MKKTFSTVLAALGLLATPLAHAWTYSDGDALLIFRASGFNDVEFNLGNVSQFTNVPSGSTITVSGWSSSLVTSTFGPDLTDVKVIVTATTSQFATSKSSWITGATAGGIVSESPTTSGWQAKYWSTINAIGTKPILNTVTPTSTNAYSIDPSGDAKAASYDYIVTAGGLRNSQIASLGGNAAFNVEGVTPGGFAFWQIKPNSAAQYVGTFNITTNGVLTYTAGPFAQSAAPNITGISRAGSISSVSFSTVSGGNYYLTYASTLSSSSTNWPVVNGPIAGTGSPLTLTHTNAGATGYYRVYRTP